MERIDAEGRELTLGLFIRAYKAALNLAPGRFLTLRINPESWASIAGQAEDITHVVNIQDMPAPFGRRALKVACVPAPKGVGEGVTVVQDGGMDKSTFQFEIHGAPELEVVNIAMNNGRLLT